jgi:hypothetical protein
VLVNPKTAEALNPLWEAADSPPSAARFVRCGLDVKTRWLEKRRAAQKP